MLKESIDHILSCTIFAQLLGDTCFDKVCRKLETSHLKMWHSGNKNESYASRVKNLQFNPWKPEFPIVMTII